MPLPLNEQAERMARQVLDEYRRTGALPGPFRQRLHDRFGAWPSWSDVKAEVRPWAQDFCAETDRGQKPQLAGK